MLHQNYPNLEYIIQDNCSDDNTFECLQSFSHSELSTFVENDNGQADAINRGFARSTGEIMCWLNSDDLLAPNALLLVAEYFMQHPKVDVVYGNRVIINESGDEVGQWILPRHDPMVLQLVDYVPQETLFWRREAWERVGAKLDDGLHFALDWDLLLRFYKVNATFSHLPTLFGFFRSHSGQKTSSLIHSVGKKEMAQVRAKMNHSWVDFIILRYYHLKFLLDHFKMKKY